MAKLNSTVKASTLLEVIISMVIILIVFSLAIGIYNNVLGSTDSAKNEQVNALLAKVISESINESNWTDEETNLDNLQLKKTVTPYEDFADLVVITVTATQHNQQIGVLKRIVKRTSDGR